MEDKKRKIEHLVVDTTAFLQNAPLHQYAENIYTCQEVIDEVTSKRQRHRLLVLPYDLKVKPVFPENIDAVADFSKKTGDYASLSVTDLKVLALTYQMEKEKVGVSHIRTAPVCQKSVSYDYIKKKPTDIRCNLPGWYTPKNDEISEEEGEDSESTETGESSGSEAEDDYEENESNTGNEDISEKELEVLREKFGNVNFEDHGESSKAVDEVLEKVEDGFEEIDEEGWITPNNYKRAKQMMYDTAGETEDKEVSVACMTTDFAIQNVLKQMNLNVVALNGRVIKHVRTFILRCYACFKTTTDMTKRFCPKCGNQTLKKVSVSLDEEGKMVIHINGRKRISGRGKRFSLPTIKGGKHPNNPYLVEDQRFPDNKPSKRAIQKNNPLDDDWIAGYSPFVMRDVTSKAAQLGIQSFNRQKKGGRTRGRR